MKWIILVIALGLCAFAECNEEEREGRIIAAYSTKTAFSFTTSTTTVPLTCASATNAIVCKRRRYRRYSNIGMLPDPRNDESANIGPSLNDHLEAIETREQRAIPEEKDDRQGRIALTVWSTTTSTYTITSSSVNSATTFSLSYYCTVDGFNAVPAC